MSRPNKICIKCGKNRRLENFNTPRTSVCRYCRTIKRVCKQCGFTKNAKSFYVEWENVCITCRQNNTKEDRKVNPLKYHQYDKDRIIKPHRWIYITKKSAEKRGIYFNLTEKELENIDYPLQCEVLHLPLEYKKAGVSKHNSPSIDRIDNTKGYTIDNIRIISLRANLLKGQATPDEQILIGKDGERLKEKINLLKGT